MVFSTKTIKSCNSSLFNQNNNEPIKSYDKSFFVEALDLLLENKELTASIYNIALNKEYSITDIKMILCNILENFINVIEKIWLDFSSSIKDMYNTNDISYYDGNYRYKNLSIPRSYTTFKNEIIKRIDNLVHRKDGDLDELNSNIIGDIIGSDPVIRKEDIPQKIFEFYREEIDEDESEELISSCSKTILFDFDKYLSIIEKSKIDLCNSAKEMMNYIQSLNLEKYISYKEDIAKEAENIKFICDTYVQVFSAKLDALRDLYIKCKRESISSELEDDMI